MSKTKRKRAPGARDAPAAKRSMLIQGDAGITTVSEWLRKLGRGYTPLDRCPEIRMCAHAYADMISDMTVHLMRHTDGGDIRQVGLHQPCARARMAQAHDLETFLGGEPPHHGAPEHARGASHDNFHGAIVP